MLPWAVFAALAVVSWNRWIEPYVDSGRELMIPWRLAHGERLYADLHFHHGPLGPYLAAIVDAAAGPSLAGRIALCAVIALLSLAALAAAARGAMPPARASLAASLAVAAAFFLRPGGWFFPFSLDASIAVAALTGAAVFASGPRAPRRDRAAGLCVLAALLARPEMGAAGAVILAVAALRAPRRIVPLAIAPVLAAAGGYAALSLGIPRRTLVADGWLRLLDPPEAFRNVYRAYAGIDRLGLRVAELALAAALLAVGGAVLAFFSRAAAGWEAEGRRGAARAFEALAVAALAGGAVFCARPPESIAPTVGLLPPLVRVIPPVLLVLAAVRLARAVGDGGGAAEPFVPDAVLWMAAFFAVRLLLAAGYVGPYDAFFLPLPIVVGVAALFRAADRFAPSLGPALPRLTFAALAIFAAFRAFALADLYRGRPWRLVPTGAGPVRLTEPVASATASALAVLGRLPPAATLSGFPEAGFFNYVLARGSPFWLEQFFPGHLDAPGEARAIRVLEERPPDALLRANVLAVGEGARAFGRDYDERLDAAVAERFRTVAIFGPGAHPGARIGDPDFFVEILAPAPPRASP